MKPTGTRYGGTYCARFVKKKECELLDRDGQNPLGAMASDIATALPSRRDFRVGQWQPVQLLNRAWDNRAAEASYRRFVMKPSNWSRSIIVAALSCAFAGGVAAGEIRVACYSDGNECEVTQDLAKRFEAQNADVKVIIDKVPYKAILETAAGAARGRRGSGHRARHRSRRAVQVLPRHHAVREGPEVLGGQLRPDAASGCARSPTDKGIYGMMTQLTVTGPFVNKTLFEQAKVPLPGPKATWDDWVEADAQGRQGDADAVRDGVRPQRPPLRGAGDQPWAPRSSTPRATWSIDDGYKAMAKKFVRLEPATARCRRKSGAASAARTYRDAFEEFANGRVVMYLSGSWQITPHGHADRQELRLDRRAEPVRPGGVHRHARRRRVRRVEAHQEPEGCRPRSSTSWRATPIYAEYMATHREHPGARRRSPRRASTTTSRRRPRPRSTRSSADVAEARRRSPTRSRATSYNRALFNPTAARLGQAIAGEMSARRCAEAHQRRTSTSRSRRRRSRPRARRVPARRIGARAVALLALPACAGARCSTRSTRRCARCSACSACRASRWLFVAPNLVDLRRSSPSCRSSSTSTTPSPAACSSTRRERPFTGCENLATLFDCGNYLDPSTCRKDLFWRAVCNTAKFALLQVGADGAVRAGHGAGAQPQDHRPRLLARRVLLSRCCCRRSSSR